MADSILSVDRCRSGGGYYNCSPNRMFAIRSGNKGVDARAGPAAIQLTFLPSASSVFRLSGASSQRESRNLASGSLRELNERFPHASLYS